MTIDEPIHLETYDPAWPQYFEHERDRICAALGLDVTAIEHIGSTAVFGLRAKPIIDIMLGVDGFPPPPHMLDELFHLGHEPLSEAGVPVRLYFRRREAVSFNVHVIEREGTHWKSNLALRDYLRRHPEEVSRYEEAKVTAVRSGALSLLKYSEAKAAVVTELGSRALAWRAATWLRSAGRAPDPHGSRTVREVEQAGSVEGEGG
jgi:GrpB-like predicted nucleotidyltransferase (UPF0157 family)